MLAAGRSYGSYCFGVWGGRTVSPSLCPSFNSSSSFRQTLLPPHELQKCSELAIRILPIAVHPHAQVLGVFGLTQTFPWLHEVAEHPRTANSRPSCCVCIHGQKRSCLFCTSLPMCKPVSSLIPWRIMPSLGVATLLRD